MKLRLTATTVWNVAPEDEDSAHDILKNQPKEVIFDCINDAAMGDPEFVDTITKAEEVK